MKFAQILATAGIIQAVLLTGAMAGENLDAIKSAGVLKIGTEGTYAPFTYHDKDNKLVGFDVEIGEAVAAKLGVKPEFVDAVINQVGITEERQKKFNFSNPYIVSKVVLIVNDKNDTIKDFADLKGKKSAQSLTSNYGKLAKEAGAELVATDGFDQSIQLVLTGRADATLNDSLSFLYFKKHQPKAPVKVVAEKENADASGIIVRKGDDELVAAINKALDEIKADGTYDKISQKYFGQDVSK